LNENEIDGYVIDWNDDHDVDSGFDPS
jgi:hypothetical protein